MWEAHNDGCWDRSWRRGKLYVLIPRRHSFWFFCNLRAYIFTLQSFGWPCSRPKSVYKVRGQEESMWTAGLMSEKSSALLKGKWLKAQVSGVTNPWLSWSCSFILIGPGGWFQEDALVTLPSTRTRSGPHCGSPVLPCEHHGGISIEATESRAWKQLRGNRVLVWSFSNKSIIHNK